MNRIITPLGLLAAICLALPGISSAAPSAKFAAQLSSATLIPETTVAAPTVVLTTKIKTPNKKDLLLGASLETGLFTRTKTTGKNGSADTATATAGIRVKVLVDGSEAFPGEVIFDERIQTLNTVLGGVIGECADTDNFSYVDADGDGILECVDNTPGVLTPDGKITVACECTVTDEEIELLLRTTAAHHFNFVAKNLEPGEHTVEVQVQVITSIDGDASATGLVGKGSLTVEEVRATNSPDGIEFLD